MHLLKKRETEPATSVLFVQVRNYFMNYIALRASKALFKICTNDNPPQFSVIFKSTWWRLIRNYGRKAKLHELWKCFDKMYCLHSKLTMEYRKYLVRCSREGRFVRICSWNYIELAVYAREERFAESGERERENEIDRA